MGRTFRRSYERQKIGKTRNIKIIGWDTDNDAIEISIQHAINAQVDNLSLLSKRFYKIEEEDIPQEKTMSYRSSSWYKVENSSIVNLSCNG